MARSSRRRFLKQAATAAAGMVILPHAASAYGYPANEKLDIALIGNGGRGSWFVQCIPQIGENVVAMCDVNWDRAAESFAKLPDPPKYRDFRKLFDERADEIDAVIIAVPDHNHTVIAAAAMDLGKHVYCEKPLANSIGEARFLREKAKRTGVATQMGNQGTATHAYREQVELIQSGVLGPIKEIIVWNANGGGARPPIPKGQGDPPETLDWDTWLGPRAYRPYDRQWMQWHRWREFGTGQLGNWCVHSGNIVFKGLRLDRLWLDPKAAGDAPNRMRVKARVADIIEESFPAWEIIEYSFPARGEMPPFQYTWLNGLKAPGFRERIETHLGRRLVAGGTDPWTEHAGCLVVWENAVLHSTGHNSTYKLLPEDKFKDFQLPTATLPRSGSHEREWLSACRGGPTAMSNFDYGGPWTECILLGNIATQMDRPIEFDPIAGRFVDDPEADRHLMRSYRREFALS